MMVLTRASILAITAVRNGLSVLTPCNRPRPAEWLSSSRRRCVQRGGAETAAVLSQTLLDLEQRLTLPTSDTR